MSAQVVSRPVPRFAEGDWAYSPLKRHNARIVSVSWDPSLNGFNGGWRYAVPGFSTPDMMWEHEDMPYVEYEQVPGRSHCWREVAIAAAPNGEQA